MYQGCHTKYCDSSSSERSAGWDVTSDRGTVALLVWKACRSARSHTRRKHMEVLNLHQEVNL